MNRMQTRAYQDAKRTALQKHSEQMHAIETLIYNLRLPENKGRNMLIIANPALYKVLGKNFIGVPVEPIEKYSQLHFAGDYEFTILDA